MQVKGLNQSILGLANWSQFLMRSALLSATLLLSSALIMAVAANWLSWPKVGRIALLELTVAGLVLVAGWLVRREPKGWATAYSLSSLAQIVAAISVGGLLALIGQSYQTGADPWQLFALWAVLLLPWAFGLGSLFIILLVIFLTNLALFLYVEEVDGWYGLQGWGVSLVGAMFVLLNAFWLALSRWWAAPLSDPHQLWFRSSFLLLVASGVVWCVTQDQYLWTALSLALLVVLWCSRSSRRQLELWNLAVWYSALFAVALFWLVHSFRVLDLPLELLFMPMFLVAAILIRDLRLMWLKQIQQTEKADPLSAEDRSEPWFLRGFVLLAQCILVLLFVWIALGLFEFEVVTLAYVYLPLAAVLVVSMLLRVRSALWLQDLPLFLYLSSAFFVGVLLLEASQPDLLLIAVFLLYAVVVYGLSAAHYLLRLSSAGVAWGLVLYGMMWFGDLFSAANTRLVLGSLSSVWLGLTVWLTMQPAVRRQLQPLWWATVFWLMVATVGLDTDQVWLQRLMAAAVPVVTLCSLYRSQSIWFCLGVVLITASLSFFWLLSAPLVNLAVALWLLSYSWQQRRLFWFALVLFAAALGQYYYSLALPLMYKAGDLAQGAALLLLGAVMLFVLQRDQKPEATAEPGTTATVISPWIKAALYGGWAVILVLTVGDVARKEQLLAQGQELILELAPVDPRSLMQGDYMALRFAIGTSIAQLSAIQNSGLERRELIAYMQPMPQAAARLVGLKNPTTDQYWLWDTVAQTWRSTTALLAQQTGVYPLRLRYKSNEWLPNGVDAWFFPEGSAALYEDARYGAFKVNHKAEALLYELLNDQVQPM